MPEKVRDLEGGVIRITYKLPAKRSSLEVFENYRRKLEGAGFSILFQWSNKVLDRGSRLAGKDKTQNYLGAHLSRPEGDVYVALYVVRRSAKQLVER